MAPNILETRCIAEVELKDCFSDPLVDVMNFLNQIVMKYPAAISFAPGRPLEEHFHVERCLQHILEFVRVSARSSCKSEKEMWQQLGQYGRTNGAINELIAWHLERDEGIRVSPEAIIVTVGAQEAMALILTGLFDPAQDILLAGDPTYIGITGLARVLGIQVVPVLSGDDGIDPDRLERTIQECSGTRKPKAFYDIPDFNNPLGTTLSLHRRQRLLEICRKHKILIIEDNPYGMFIYEGEKIPTIKALDSDHSVLYIGSFSKTIFPGARLGYLVADQHVRATENLLAVELSKVKSLLTVNTSPLLQAMVGGILLANGGSLQHVVSPKVKAFSENRDVMLECLEHHFSDMEMFVRWNRPKGGFFITVTLPFSFDDKEFKCCASEYGVIVCPMHFFTIDGGRKNQIRLSFSYVEEAQIRDGVKRLAAYVKSRCPVA